MKATVGAFAVFLALSPWTGAAAAGNETGENPETTAVAPSPDPGPEAAGKTVPPELAAAATALVGAIEGRYAAVTNARVTVRREIPDAQEEMVSRVSWAKGGFLASKTLSPVARQVIVDGDSAWSMAPGDKKPRRIPFAEQTDAQKRSVLFPPGSPLDMVSVLDPATAADLPAGHAGFARRVEFRPKDVASSQDSRAVLSLDHEGRVRQLELFSDAARRWLVASYSWDAPVEALPDVWLFGRVTVETAVDGHPVSLSSRFGDFRLNEPLPPGTFDAAKAFPGDKRR